MKHGDWDLGVTHLDAGRARCVVTDHACVDPWCLCVSRRLTPEEEAATRAIKDPARCLLPELVCPAEISLPVLQSFFFIVERTVPASSMRITRVDPFSVAQLLGVLSCVPELLDGEVFCPKPKNPTPAGEGMLTRGRTSRTRIPSLPPATDSPRASSRACAQ